jgi:hypothetical protein
MAAMVKACTAKGKVGIGRYHMPVKRVTRTRKGRTSPGYRWGSTGKIYFYKAGDKSSRAKAYKKAQAQGKAVKASQGRRK